MFIDKPIALSSEDVKEIREVAETHRIQVMSSSSLRYADGLVTAMNSVRDSSIQSAYIYGPLPMQEGIRGYFWYGIHMLELAFAMMGNNVQTVEVERFKHYELCRLTYDGGRSAVIRGDYNMHGRFGFVAHTPSNTLSAELWKDEKPYYAGLLEKIIDFFQTGIPPVSLQETQKLIEIIEDIHRKREYGHDSAY
ncbi:hypothetical protein [Neobacillus citreus]|uniref:Uncharacterized protein n=1 Tax=Neobacillus citreus TaxID=2833578 RepID=A0A942T7L7_9BACI|nr:hypothetical protein [Neobacillus citreus]MCH6268975.1 hypothetical protein [Neobacillus citreus]